MKKKVITQIIGDVTEVDQFESGIYVVRSDKGRLFIDKDVQEVYRSFADCVRREYSVSSVQGWNTVMKKINKFMENTTPNELQIDLVKRLNERLEERVVIEVQSKARIDQAIAKRNERKYGKVKY